MKRRLYVLGIIAVIIVLGYFVRNNYKYFQKQNGGTFNTPSPTQSMKEDKNNDLLHAVTPIEHATMKISLGAQVIYTDPVGGKEKFSGLSAPTVILVTDIHSDHMSAETLRDVSTKATKIIVPQAVYDALPKDIPGELIIMKNGEEKNVYDLKITAIPMYNIPESKDAFHTKGRGNGYIVEYNGQRMYIAGDTSVTPEMKALQKIDLAFVPMNLPYTMSVEEAAEGVLAFKPKIAVPYHYRGPNGLSDTKKFKELVESKDSGIQVELLNFYPN